MKIPCPHCLGPHWHQPYLKLNSNYCSLGKMVEMEKAGWKYFLSKPQYHLPFQPQIRTRIELNNKVDAKLHWE